MVRNARRHFIENMIQSANGDQNRLWQVVRYVLKNDTRQAHNDLPSEIILSDGEVIRDRDKILEELNRHFSEISVELKNTLLSTNSNRPLIFTLTRSVDSSIYARPTNALEITKILSKMNMKSAVGVDRVSVKFMKELGPSFVQALVTAINDSLRLGDFPSSFKDARITSLFKGGEANKTINYRPLCYSQPF